MGARGQYGPFGMRMKWTFLEDPPRKCKLIVKMVQAFLKLYTKRN